MNERVLAKLLPKITFFICFSAILLTSLRIFYHLFNHSNGFLVVPQDDFYYYLLTAKNIVHHGKSSFDGVTLTNGYHPLWMLAVIIMEVLSFGNDTILFFEYGCICFLSCLITYTLTVSILKRIFQNSWIIYSAVILATVSSFWMIFWGMEITLTIPLYLYFILKIQNYSTQLPSKKESAYFGFLSSLLILSRLDSVIFVALIVVYFFYTMQGSFKEKIYLIPYFVLGGLPLAIYFFINYFTFGSFSTVSAQAKQLILFPHLDLSVFAEIATWRDGLIALILTPIALIQLIFFRNNLKNSKPFFLIPILLFPFIFLVIYRTFSDWYLFGWYAYAFPIANGIALSSILYVIIHKFFKRPPIVLGYVCLLAICLLVIPVLYMRTVEGTIGWMPHPGSIYAHAMKIKEFTDNHPGTYAMADRAGLTAYLISKPVVQLEGIITDQKMVDHIAAGDDLNNVLKEYHVQYVIFTIYAPMPRKDNCYYIEVPFEDLSGKRSKRMHGSFCQSPEFYFESEVEPRIYTYIFRVF